jgi:hypothetical protein
VGEERGELRPAVAVTVEVRGAAGVLAPDDKPVAAQDGDRGVRGDPAQRGAVGELRVEERVRLDDTDVGRLAPQARRPVDRARDDRDDEDDEPDAEPGRREHVEQLQPLQRVDDGDAHGGVVAVVHLAHLIRVVGQRTEREVRQLPEGHADDREDGEVGDLDDREVDGGQQAPDRRSEAEQRVERRAAAGTGRGQPDGRGRDGELLAVGRGVDDRGGRG